MQDVVFAADDCFQNGPVSLTLYLYVGGVCLLLFGIKLMYVDDFPTLAQDHALLMNRTSAFFYHKGQFVLVISTTVMATGLVMLTRSYVSQRDHVPKMTKQLVCWGFATVTLATFFIKSLHLQRVPSERRQKVSFYVTYVAQTIVMWSVVVLAGLFPFWSSHLSFAGREEVTIIATLCFLELVLMCVSWCDEILEVSFFASGEDSRQNMVEPFGIWWFLKAEPVEKPQFEDLMKEQEMTESTSLLEGGKKVNYDGSKLVPVV